MIGKVVIVVAVVLLALWTGWGLYVIYSTERPTYDVVRELSSRVQIRQYKQQTWISTAYSTDNSSFRVLASYIFGQNKEGETVSMTAPVVTDEKMSFILPEGMNPENAPAPDGQAIEFTTVPPRKLATLTFSWWTSQSRVEKKRAELLDVLLKYDVETKGRVFLMRYNDPWTPPFLRRNEVAVEIANEQ